MKNLPYFLCLVLAALSGAAQAQKVKIYQTRFYHYDQSSVKGIVYDVGPQGVVLLDKKAASALSAKAIRKAVSTDQLPRFTVPFQEIQRINIKRYKAAGKGFGLGYLASFVTLETSMIANTLSSDKIGCDGTRQKPSFGEAVIGASCAAPPGILVFGIVSLVGGGIGSLIGSIPVKQLTLDSRNPETDAREKLGKYALLLQKNPTFTVR
jgi:hypothetical protein